MKLKTFRSFILVSLICLTSIIIAQPSPVVKLFDVRNGNGVVDSGTTYPFAITIVFKDKASHDAVVAAFASQYGYQATIPDPANAGQTIANPQSTKQFTMAKITQYLKGIYRADAVTAATKSAGTTASSAVDAVVPPQ